MSDCRITDAQLVDSMFVTDAVRGGVSLVALTWARYLRGFMPQVVHQSPAWARSLSQFPAANDRATEFERASTIVNWAWDGVSQLQYLAGGAGIGGDGQWRALVATRSAATADIVAHTMRLAAVSLPISQKATYNTMALTASAACGLAVQWRLVQQERNENSNVTPLNSNRAWLLWQTVIRTAVEVRVNTFTTRMHNAGLHDHDIPEAWIRMVEPVSCLQTMARI